MSSPPPHADACVGSPSSWAQLLLEQTRHLILLTDGEGTVLDGSPAMFEVLGDDRAARIGAPLETVVRWRDQPEIRRRIRVALAAAREGRTVREVFAVSTGPGAHTARNADDGWLEFVLRPVDDPRSLRGGSSGDGSSGDGSAGDESSGDDSSGDLSAGGPTPAIVIEGHRSPPSAAGQMRLALDVAGTAMWTWDLADDRISWVGRSDRLLGWPASDGGVDDAIIRRVHPDDRPRVQAALRQAMAGRAAMDLEFRIFRSDGSGVVWLLARGQVERDDAGRPVRVTGVVVDVTERVEARIEHARLLENERRANHRAAALQRVTAALSEAATCEQVAAVMAEESLRSLGVHAARVELATAPTVVPREREGLVVRAAGVAALLAEPTTADHSGIGRREGDGTVAMTLALSSRGRWRGRWLIAWRTTSAPPEAAHASRTADPSRPDADPGDPGVLDWDGPDGEDLLRTLAAECAQALDRAELYEQQRDIATVLQRTLLPAGLPDVAEAQIAARYQPGGQGVDVGGDWYDVIALPAGRTGLVIGDVEGHSAVAAAVMGQVRNALRAYAVEGSTPATVMERLNRLLVRMRVTHLVTCCYLEFAPTEGTATVVLAGHPPPLLLRGDGHAEYVPARPNLVLGVDAGAAYTETTVLLDPGARLLLYTDGLVEAIDRALPDGLDQLLSWARDRDLDDSTDEVVEQLVRRARDGDPVLDDVAVLALRYLPTRPVLGGTRSVRRTFPLDPTSASAARRFVADVLAQWGCERLTHQVTLMASELVTNSVLHTSGELELALRREVDRLRVEVLDRSERLPTVQHPDTDAPGGRGLLIISALAESWGVDVRGDGKAVWFEVLLDPAPITLVHDHPSCA